MEQTRYKVTAWDASPGPSPYIPTFGSPASAVDIYRTVDAETNLLEIGGAFTDIASVTGLAKLAEGGFVSYDELMAAETALQAILLHDYVSVVVPTPKVTNGGFTGYRRTDEGLRTDYCFDLMRIVQSKDLLVAPELLVLDNNIVQAAANHPFAGQELSSATLSVYARGEAAVRAMDIALDVHGVPSYLSNPNFTQTRDGGFYQRFYNSMREPWDAVTAKVPPIICRFNLPPMLAIVLSRMNNRQDLKDALIALREEIAPARAQLIELTALPHAAISQAEMVDRIKRVEESFLAIVAESQLTDVQRRARAISTTFIIVRPILKIGAALLHAKGIPLTGNGPGDGYHKRSVIDRTVTAQIFSDLLKTEGVQSLAKHHLSDAEIRAIEASMPRN